MNKMSFESNETAHCSQVLLSNSSNQGLQSSGFTGKQLIIARISVKTNKRLKVDDFRRKHVILIIMETFPKERECY